MNFKKIGLILIIVSFLALSCVKEIKAETLEEISAQITTLKNQITEYQKKIAELQTEIARLLAKQISIVQGQITQLQTQLQSKTPTKPESEFKCPDLDGNGTVDMKDVGLATNKQNICLGQANYDTKADVDSNNCINRVDLDYVNKYFGKKISEIAQCKGAIIIKPLAKPESECKCPDLDKNGKVDMVDIGIVANGANACSGDTNYNATADIDGDNCVTQADLDYVTKYFGKKAEDITQCKSAPVLAKPESECKCPDLDQNGQIDMVDIGIATNGINTCSGQAKYNTKADVDGNNCITQADVNYVTKYYGKMISAITQCKGAVITSPTLFVGLYAAPSSGVSPLNGVDLSASVAGTATGSINYTFYCDRSDTGTSIISGSCQRKEGLIQTSYIANDCCNFSVVGTYTTKVIAERNGLQAEARTTITVNPKAESLWGCPDIDGSGIVDMKDVGLVTNKINNCLGNANFDPKLDFNGDNCITITDINYVSNYFGKKIGEITQCQ